ncbi:unnamed protein product [Ceutorhynchus assimilis]|uniref:Uncharacterized protein n=1 Tax=Ceutorhynchus assimilis TaxID=467358 RepID=A0A9N9MDK8_9CUCU|nr:unnamed protein product [Ceutorhynchus assimilis]
MALKTVLIIFVSLGALLEFAQAISCRIDYCGTLFHCPTEVEICEGENQFIGWGNWCGCCQVCYTLLEKNENCNYTESLLFGAPLPTTLCKDDLKCIDGICTDLSTGTDKGTDIGTAAATATGKHKQRRRKRLGQRHQRQRQAQAQAQAQAQGQGQPRQQ